MDLAELSDDTRDLVTIAAVFTGLLGLVLIWSPLFPALRVFDEVVLWYQTVVDKALALMREAAEEHPQVLAEPPPLLSFDNFGDNALTLTQGAYLTHIDYFIDASTDLHSAINRKFQQAGISIAFPQRYLHVYAHEPFRVNIERPRQQQPEPGNAG